MYHARQYKWSARSARTKPTDTHHATKDTRCNPSIYIVPPSPSILCSYSLSLSRSSSVPLFRRLFPHHPLLDSIIIVAQYCTLSLSLVLSHVRLYPSSSNPAKHFCFPVLSPFRPVQRMLSIICRSVYYFQQVLRRQGPKQFPCELVTCRSRETNSRFLVPDLSSFHRPCKPTTHLPFKTQAMMVSLTLLRPDFPIYRAHLASSCPHARTEYSQ